MWEASKEKWNGLKPRKSVKIWKEEERMGRLYSIITYRYFVIKIERSSPLNVLLFASIHRFFFNILPYPDLMLTVLYTLKFWCFLAQIIESGVNTLPSTCLCTGFVSKFYDLAWKDELNQSDLHTLSSFLFFVFKPRN